MADWLIRVLKGALIGVGAILPGISGGVLSVVMGIYRPMMDFLAHPFQTFRKNAAFFVPIIIGFGIGVIVLARLLGWLLEVYQVQATWLFIGLMVGTFPSLWVDAGKHGRPKGAYAAMIAAGLVIGGLLLWLSLSGRMHVTPNFWWWCLCGVLWAMGLIIPGLSPSSFFFFFGLYDRMMTGMGSLDMAIILPMALGMLVTIVILARGMNYLLEKAFPYVMHGILGVVAAATIAIIPFGSSLGVVDIIICAVCFAAGFGVALMMARMSGKIKPKHKESPA